MQAAVARAHVAHHRAVCCFQLWPNSGCLCNLQTQFQCRRSAPNAHRTMDQILINVLQSEDPTGIVTNIERTPEVRGSALCCSCHVTAVCMAHGQKLPIARSVRHSHRPRRHPSCNCCAAGVQGGRALVPVQGAGAPAHGDPADAVPLLSGAWPCQHVVSDEHIFGRQKSSCLLHCRPGPSSVCPWRTSVSDRQLGTWKSAAMEGR